ncbi:PilZ domain-containing protein [Leeia oryzae]|uniref:PilZ domain-containing protein n=1 Tax=Leeia oryzae TaxID=356662 RepID=UPI0003701F16|nr:PilZ domain-containing protein [Leeia oryzae]
MTTSIFSIPFERPLRITPASEANPPYTASWYNLLLLRGIAQLHEADNEPGHENQQLTRLEGKLDVALLLLAEVVGQHHPLPPMARFSLGTTSLTLNTDTAYTAGETCLLDIYLEERLPLALKLSATVESSVPGECRFAIAELPDEVDHWLGQILFRHHREQLRKQG